MPKLQILGAERLKPVRVSVYLLADLGAMEHVLEALQLKDQHIRRPVNGQPLERPHQLCLQGMRGISDIALLQRESNAEKTCRNIGRQGLAVRKADKGCPWGVLLPATHTMLQFMLTWVGLGLFGH